MLPTGLSKGHVQRYLTTGCVHQYHVLLSTAFPQVVFTDHSLFGFADAVSIVMNRLLECVLADVQHVSHTNMCQHHTMSLRASCDAHKPGKICFGDAACSDSTRVASNS
jgi:hypothetical protein